MGPKNTMSLIVSLPTMYRFAWMVTITAGDYQAGGGRQHSKTLVIDAYTDNPVILTAI